VLFGRAAIDETERADVLASNPKAEGQRSDGIRDCVGVDIREKVLSDLKRDFWMNAEDAIQDDIILRIVQTHQ
jgi:hypothetical protein